MIEPPSVEMMALMPLTDLRVALKKNGIVDIPRTTLRNWYLIGVSTPRGKVKLKTRKIGGRHMSSIWWTMEFLERQQ